MRKTATILSALLFISFVGLESCSSGSGGNKGSKNNKGKAKKEKKEKDKKPKSIEEGKGIGPVKEIELTEVKDDWAKEGKAVHGKKCASCHKLTDKRAVGPGWAGITNKRKPEWIMNMIMNTSVMLEKDPEARKQLEECATRMPNQNLSREKARKVLEFMRKNDLEKVGKKDQAVKS